MRTSSGSQAPPGYYYLHGCTTGPRSERNLAPRPLRAAWLQRQEGSGAALRTGERFGSLSGGPTRRKPGPRTGAGRGGGEDQEKGREINIGSLFGPIFFIGTKGANRDG